MLNQETKRQIDNARDILVGKVPDPKAQVEQITTALIYKFMDDMDRQNEEMDGKAQFLTGDLKEYSWGKLLSKKKSGQERMDLYVRALSEFSKAKQIPELFRKIFKDTFLPYRDSHTLNLFLKEIDKFKYSHSEDLGNAYEYLLSILGSQGEAGQFRTPRHIIDFIVEVLNPEKNETILDPACGTAGFLISSYRHICRKNSTNFDSKKYIPSFAKKEDSEASTVEIQSDGEYKGDKLTPPERKKLARNIVGYDISPDMVRLSLVNMYLHGFKKPKIYEYDTLSYQERWDDTFDVIMANPPFMTPKGGIKPHDKFQVRSKRSEVLFVNYIMEHLNINGRAGVIVPEGIIFRSSNSYKKLRKLLIEDNLLYAVVSLPAGVFKPYSGVKTSILFMDRDFAKKSKKILFIDVKNDGFDLGAQRRRIDKNDLPQAFKILKKWREGKEQDFEKIDIANSVEKEEIIESGDWNLSSDRYKKVIDYSDVKWDLVKLGDVCKIIKGSAITKKETSPGNIPVIAGGRTPAYPHNEANRDGNVITVSASGAYAGYVNYWKKPIFASDCSTIRSKDENKLLTKFVYLLLHNKQETVYKLQKGMGQPHVYPKDLKTLKIPLPPLKIQKQIAEELEAYQKVIDGAKQIVENWKPKIDIDPEWAIHKFEDVCTLEYGSGLPKRKRKPGKVPVMGSNGRCGYHNEPLIEGPAIIVGRKGSVGEVVWEEKDCFPIDTTYYIKLVRPEETNLKFIYYVLDSLGLEKEISGAGIPGLNRNDVYSKFKLPLPPLETQKNLVARLEEEKGLVEASRKLVELHKKKIKERIAKIWGEQT